MVVFGHFLLFLACFRPCLKVVSFFYYVATKFRLMCLRINKKDLETRFFRRYFWFFKYFFDRFWPFLSIFGYIFIQKFKSQDFFVDSEAHQSKISCYLANIIKQPLNKAGNKPKIEKMTKNGPASKFWEFLAPLIAQVPRFFLLILTYIWCGNDII